MRKSVLAILLGASFVSACDSRMNPMTWFGARAPVSDGTTVAGSVPPLVPEDRKLRIIERRGPIAQITSLDVAPTSHGALITAQGLAPGAGYFNAELVEVQAPGATTRAFEFRAEKPEVAPPATGTGALQITAAKFLTDQELAGVTSITVRAAQNALSRRP
ncbi:hypothetical protein [Poseidonocella sedimentorum]|uniref:Lipoprotein n=1 Tax=Poseidonocella sedimentorum TaxID=871652 RepID=A0A1I6DDB4_9RHOB|nr:hypothetical protein [Poseidonocella sedimentorum]SFR03388.1 hypothetical protein SAMN04515673_10310 [Poseidonocella sedimentorum]